MTDRIRTLGGFVIAFGVLWLAIGIAASLIVGFVVDAEGSALDRRLADIVQAGLVWAGVLLLVFYSAAGTGLIMGQSWGRAAALSLWLVTLTVPLLGWALAIAMVAVLVQDREDPEFGVRIAS